MPEDESIASIIDEAVKRLRTQEAEARKKEIELKSRGEEMGRQKADLDTLEQRLRVKEDSLRQKEAAADQRAEVLK
jgi:uncharacterized protein involved in exopolysaccharide biosynthesis